MNFRNLHNNVKIRIIEQFLSNLIGNAIFPFMGIYLATKVGPTLTGFLLASNIIIGFIAGFYGGYIADQYGRRKIMVKAEKVRFLATVIMAFSCSPWFESPWIIYIMMTISAVCLGLSRPAAEAIIIDSSTEETRKYIYSLNYWFLNVSILLGSMGGALLFENYRFELFLILALLSLTSIILLKFFIVDIYIPSEKSMGRKNFFRDMYNNYSSVMNDTVFKVFLLATLLQLSVEFQSSNYTGVRLANEFSIITEIYMFGYSFEINGVGLYGLINSVNTSIVILAGTLVTKVVRHLPVQKTLYIGLFLYTLGYSILAHSNSLWILLGMTCMLSIGELMIAPILQAELAEMVPNGKRSSYLAINALTLRFASMLGSFSITLGSFIPSWVISCEIFITGVLSMFLFAKVLKIRNKERLNLITTNQTA